MYTKMYSPSSPVLSQTLDHQSIGLSSLNQQQTNSQCLKFKYFTTFLICTTCLALLSASLATHKWIVSKPMRFLPRLNNGGQHNSATTTTTNLTSLMLSAQNDHFQDQPQSRPSSPFNLPLFSSILSSPSPSHHQPNSFNSFDIASIINSGGGGSGSQSIHSSQNNKFQGEIYFGLFKGVKVLNYGFGDRISSLSILQNFYAKDNNGNNQQELINFKLWLVTLVGVATAILFALIGSIFAIINFVMTPRGTLTGPVGLVTWNAIACFSCLLAMVSWLIEYFVRLQNNVLTMEEVQNGWTSENRSQFGYSYYLVVLAFVLHLVNIFIVSIVQFESWTSNKAAKRQSRAVCEGVIMLY